MSDLNDLRVSAARQLADIIDAATAPDFTFTNPEDVLPAIDALARYIIALGLHPSLRASTPQTAYRLIDAILRKHCETLTPP